MQGVVTVGVFIAWYFAVANPFNDGGADVAGWLGRRYLPACALAVAYWAVVFLLAVVMGEWIRT